jgi:predicted AlkP superfamily phosphohydrolase/phosphomutase
LSKNKKRVLFVNVPFTYPPAEVNGVLISGMMIPKDKMTSGLDS